MNFKVYSNEKLILEFKDGKIFAEEGTKAHVTLGLKVAESRKRILGVGYEPSSPYAADPLAVRLYCEQEFEDVTFTGDVPEYPEEEDGEGLVIY